jgi:hypothetical protein
MLATVLAYRQVDVYIAKKQRQQLGLCVECGGLNDPGNCPVAKCPSKQQQQQQQQQQSQ